MGDLRTEFQPARIVESEHMHGRAADRREADDLRVAPTKVPIPFVATRMEEGDDATVDRIDARQVGALAKIAALTGERKIFSGIRPAVLAGKDVLDVVDQLAILLPKETILATVACAMPDQVASSRVQG